MALPEPHHPKVFISYSHDSLEHSDRVRELSDRLRADGIDCILDQYEVAPPEGWPRWTDNQIGEAEFVLVICTKTYHRRVMGKEETGTGLGVRWEGNSIYQHIYNAGTVNPKFIPVLLESGNVGHIPTPLQGVARYAAQTEEGYEELCRRLTNQPRVLKPVLGDVPKLPALEPRERRWDFFAASLTNLTFERNPFFTGREQILKDLHDAFSKKSAGSTTQAISGLGGLGKTQTAIEYAYRHHDNYKAVFWVRADTQLALSTAFVEIARVLDLAEKDAKNPDDAVRAVNRWLENNSGWLLIFDNADVPELLKGFRPRNANGHVLLTSRAQVFDTVGTAKPFEIDVMLPNEALEFLFTRTGRDDDNAAEREAAAQIAGELGYLPLALEQGGAFITAKKARFQSYLASYRKQRLDLLQKSRPVTGEYSESVATTWALNFSEVERASEAASDLLRASAFLSSHAIPLELIIKGKAKLGPALLAALADVDEDPLALSEVLEPLTRYSFIRLDSDSQIYSIHRLVQEVLRDGMDADTQRLWAERTIRSLNEAFTNMAFENWPLFERLLLHAKAAAMLIAKWDLRFGEAARLLHCAALFCCDRGRYADAELLFKQSLEICETVWEADHPNLATSLSGLAEAYRAQGRYAEAEPLHERSLAINEKILGLEHPGVALSLNNLAALYAAQGKYAEADSLYRRSLAIREKALGPEHPDVAQSLSNYAVLLSSLGKYAEAEPLLKRSLAIREKALTPDHPDLGLSLANLAEIHRLRGRYAEAARLGERSLAISEKALGLDHPSVAQIISNLAGVYSAEGRDAEAESLYRRSLRVCDERLGPDDPRVATTLNNLAELYRGQRRYAEAEPLYKRSLEIREKILGLEHPDVALTLSNIAALYDAQGKYAEAEALFKRSLEISEKVLGADHPGVATSVHNLGGLYHAQGKYEDAEPLCRRSLEIFEKALGSDHPTVALNLRSYAALLRATKRDAEAAELEARAEAIRAKNTQQDPAK